MELPQFLLGDNTDFPDEIFIIHLGMPRCIKTKNYHREQEGFSLRGVAAKNTLTTFILFVALHHHLIFLQEYYLFFVTSCIALLVAIASHT